jgi:Ca2+-binding RTX toxin-like protein
VTQGTNGTVTINGDGTVTYTPAADFNGEDSFSYTVDDGKGGTDTATVTVTVRPAGTAAVVDIEKYVKVSEDGGGDEGLTPGYWKQCHHFDDWVEYRPCDKYKTVFKVDICCKLTLLDALKAKGGGVDALLRHSAAALLNAAHPNIDYAFSENEILSMVQNAFLTGEYEAVKNQFEIENEKGADLSDGGDSGSSTDVYDFGIDADDPPGLEVAVGELVTFTYVISNPGEVALTNVIVIDDNGTPTIPEDDLSPDMIYGCPYNIGDTNHNCQLDPGEEWLFTWATTVTTGQHGNMATVTATPVDGGPTVSDEDPAHWLGLAPEPASLGDTIWHDLYHGPCHLVDGIQDTGEPGIAGVIVNLLNGAGNLITFTTTDSHGNYKFTDLDPGTYVIEVSPDNFLAGGVLEGWYATLQNRGCDETADSDGDLSTYRSNSVTLTEGEHSIDIDFGFFTTGIELTKTGPETVRAGETITYHFRVENTGDVVLDSGAHVYDLLINPHGDHEIWSGVLQPGQVVEFDRSYTPGYGLPDMDFEIDGYGNALTTGQIIDDEFSSLGITVTTNDPLHHPAMIFDSSQPSGCDWDLGTPNRDFCGPGRGDGGGAGRPGENSQALGKILIISEDADRSDPDDNIRGGTFIFTFDTPVNVQALQMLDIDCDERGGKIIALTATGKVISTTYLPRMGNNSYQVVDVGAAGVSRLEVHLAGSGAIAGIRFGDAGLEGELINTATAVGHPVRPDGKRLPDTLSVSFWTVNVVFEPDFRNVAITSPIVENADALLTGEVANTGGRWFALMVDWGDGSPVQSYSYAAGVVAFKLTHRYLDDSPSGTTSDNYTVTLLLSQGAFADIEVVTVTVQNIAPTASLAGKTSGIPGQIMSFEGTYTDPGPLDTHIACWEIRNSSNVLVAAGTGTAWEFTPEKRDNYTVKFTVKDDDGGSDTTCLEVRVGAWILKPCQEEPEKYILSIFGSDGRDRISIRWQACRRQYVVTIRALDTDVVEKFFVDEALCKIIVYGGAGDDTIRISNKVDVDAIIYGGLGNDCIYGGSGNDRLYGGDGDDWLFGGRGNDRLFGGFGRDRLKDGPGNDFLVHGFGHHHCLKKCRNTLQDKARLLFGKMGHWNI